MTLVANVPAQLVTQPADHLFVDAADVAAAGHDLLLEGRVAHQRDAARPVDDRDLVDLVVHDRR